MLAHKDSTHFPQRTCRFAVQRPETEQSSFLMERYISAESLAGSTAFKRLGVCNVRAFAMFWHLQYPGICNFLASAISWHLQCSGIGNILALAIFWASAGDHADHPQLRLQEQRARDTASRNHSFGPSRGASEVSITVCSHTLETRSLLPQFEHYSAHHSYQGVSSHVQTTSDPWSTGEMRQQTRYVNEIRDTPGPSMICIVASKTKGQDRALLYEACITHYCL